ncbi:MAG: dihydropteroate synthase [Planctomycetota bacterium]
MNPAGAFFQALRSRASGPPLIMGVINVTPDSFSDGGRFAGPEAAVAEGQRMAAQGASILDIGGESTRPGAAPVAPEAEAERILAVIEGLRDLPVSVDTRQASVAALALRAGAILVNDVSAGADPEMFPAVAACGAGVVCMHMRGEPGTMQRDPRYADVVGEVEDFLLARAEAAEAAGVARDRILIDPGIGFGKTLSHNLALLQALPRLAGHGLPVLVGPSRKSFLGRITGREGADRRDATTAAVALCAFEGGAAVVRVHDVPAARDAASVALAWRNRLLQ